MLCGRSFSWCVLSRVLNGLLVRSRSLCVTRNSNQAGGWSSIRNASTFTVSKSGHETGIINNLTQQPSRRVIKSCETLSAHAQKGFCKSVSTRQ